MALSLSCMAAIGLIAAAQMVDLTWIQVDTNSIDPTRLIREWPLWLEDGFEFTAGVLLVFAGLAVIGAKQGQAQNTSQTEL